MARVRVTQRKNNIMKAFAARSEATGKWVVSNKKDPEPAKEIESIDSNIPNNINGVVGFLSFLRSFFINMKNWRIL